MMQVVTDLRLVEVVHVDPGQLETLYTDLGPRNAEEVVCRAMEELALRLNQCERQYRRGAISDLRKSARSLIAISEQIGMGRVARVARDVIDTIDRDDAVALAACLSRLIRTGEGSLTAVWDLQDVTL